MTPLRIVGGLLVVAGLVLVVAPTLVLDGGPAPDLFEAVERHVRWGLLVGLGAFAVARTRLRPWSITVASLAFWVTAGYLLARLLGLLLEGFDSGLQWLWVGVEAAVLAGVGAFLAHKGRRARAEAAAADPE